VLAYDAAGIKKVVGDDGQRKLMLRSCNLAGERSYEDACLALPPKLLSLD
jgi:hypothetical protein